jgi:hypothetical protein
LRFTAAYWRRKSAVVWLRLNARESPQSLLLTTLRERMRRLGRLDQCPRAPLSGSTLDRMRYLRVIDRAGNKTDYETEFVPRIGERIQLEYAVGRGAMQVHFFRVKDVVYRLQAKPDDQAAILVEEEDAAEPW